MKLIVHQQKAKVETMKSLVLPSVMLFVTAVCAAVQAQHVDGHGYTGGHPSPPYHVYPRHHASTAAESYLCGLAAAIQAQGEYNRMTAEAWATAELARRLQIQNRELAVNTRFAIQQANRQARAQTRRPRVTPEQAARLAASDRPVRLGPPELDRQTGQVSWPAAIQTEAFAVNRQRIESLLARRAATGRLGSDDLVQADGIAQAMLSTLQDRIHELPPMSYIAARKFVGRLAYELRQPVDDSATMLVALQQSP